MLLEITLYVEHRMAGRVPVGDGKILAVIENGRRRPPKSESFDAAVKHIMDTDLMPIESRRVSGHLTSLHQTYKYVYRKPNIYVMQQYDRWACAYEKDRAWWTVKAGRDDKTRFASKSEAMRDVDTWVGYDYVGDLHQKTVDKNHQTRRSQLVQKDIDDLFGKEK